MSAPADVFPIERELVPVDPSPPAWAIPQRQTLSKGLPERLDLDAQHALIVAVPTGIANEWRDADPASLVVSSDAETSPATVDDSAPLASLARPPLRVFVLVGGTLVGSTPLVAGLSRSLPDDGSRGAALDLYVDSFAVHAGSMRGAGDYGSFVQLAWRPADKGADAFESPPFNPHVAARLATRFRIDSEVGDAPQLKRTYLV